MEFDFYILTSNLIFEKPTFFVKSLGFPQF